MGGPDAYTLRARIGERVARDSLLAPFERLLRRRALLARLRRRRIVAEHGSLRAFADDHERFGVHRSADGWVLREWAPNATSVHLIGPFSGWQRRPEFAFARGAEGVFELQLPAVALAHGTRFRLHVTFPGGGGERIPACARRVVLDEGAGSWNAEVWAPAQAYRWRNPPPQSRGRPLLVYEAHVGMAQEAARVGSFDEFRRNTLPRVRAAGYDAVQLMGLAEHPYYASFGYQVTSFFAVSSRFGTPDDLKALVDEAHGMGLRVFVDLVHSHFAKNEVEGIARLDGSLDQYGFDGPRGEHPAWGSRCFDYRKHEVQRFLLSNCRFWLEEFRVDGFRFDGVTSMLYTHHGLEHVFGDYAEFFDENVDEHALVYLTLANELVHSVAPQATTIAEDVSGMPGLALPRECGGAGFDYRFAMGVADEWIRLVKDVPDEQWSMQKLWYELTNRRRDERTISYAESHDQALVGDQALIFRLIGEAIYDKMSVLRQDLRVDRGVALHKLIRLLTLLTAGDGYLNFMGNEFGHPEWIDFPRQGNDWSYAHARRQWSLVDDELLRYRHLQAFDRALLEVACAYGVPDGRDEFLLTSDERRHVLAFLRGELLVAVNLHPTASYDALPIPAAPGCYEVVLDSDEVPFGGHGRQDPAALHATFADRIQRHFLYLPLPARTALVLRAVGP
ncbi:MAG TPA: 1,4-alpha-glucan-branching enzyme [bacterium]|nr:1,4-alpha-glucan-branching enzyme [bacterium]